MSEASQDATAAGAVRNAAEKTRAAQDETGSPALGALSDAPITSPAEDRFGVSSYVDALCSFIRMSETPLTLAIQGPWGSGKTSFMRMIESRLCDPALPDSERFDSIWLDTWSLFMEDDRDDATAKLTCSLLSQMAAHFSRDRGLVSSKRREALAEGVRAVSSVVLNMLNVESDNVDSIVSTLGMGGGQARVSDVKGQLEEAIERGISEPGNGVSDRGFLIFVDDLDRLDPGVAVALLEALKNLFDIRRCLFVLAIDFDVVRVGVERKYGTVAAGGRDIAQDFFDKIIQMSFAVPISHYDVMPLVNGRLRSFSFFSDERDYVRLRDQVRAIVILSTARNPRTIKTVLNTLQITVALDKSARQPADYRLMQLLLAGMSKSFPDLYAAVAQTRRLDVLLRKAGLAEGAGAEERRRALRPFIRTDDVAGTRLARADRLLAIYEDLRARCERQDIPLDELFGTMSTLHGGDAAGRVYYKGDEYDSSSQTQRAWGSDLIGRTDFTGVRTMLDVGCGNGAVTIEAWRRHPGMHVTGIDISESAVMVALRNYDQARRGLAGAATEGATAFLGETSSPRAGVDVTGNVAGAATDGAASAPTLGEIDFRILDVENLAVQNRYDLVFSSSAMHWCPHPKRAYGRIFQSLKPGGRLSVMQGGKGTYRGLHANARRAIQNLGFGRCLEGWKYPVFYPTRDELEELLRSIGYRQVTVEAVEGADETSIKDLPSNFAVASLIFYKEAGLTDEQYAQVEKEFMRLCDEEPWDAYANMLFVSAEK